MASSTEFDKARLMEFVERLEAYNETIADCNASKKEIYSEAKAEGFAKKGIDWIIKQRKKDRDEIEEEKELFTSYEKAAGL